MKEEQNKSWEDQDKILDTLDALRVSIESFMRWNTDLEKTVLKIYRHELKKRGIEYNKVEKFVYIDKEGKYCSKGARLELYMYTHDEKVYFIEVKAYGYTDDVEWFMFKSEIIKKIIGKEPEKLIFIAIHLDKDAAERAKQLEIDTIYSTIIS